MFRGCAEHFRAVSGYGVELCRDGKLMNDTRKTPPTGRPDKTAPPDAARAARAARVDPISAGLKALWASMENEPVPDEFLALLDQIDAARPPADTPAADPPDADAGPAA